MWMDSSHERMAMETSHVRDSGHDFITQTYYNPLKF